MRSTSIRFGPSGLLGTLAAAGLWAGAGCKPAGGAAPDKAAEAPPIPVTVDVVRVENLQKRVAAVGTLFPDEEVILSSQVEGRITQVFAEVGDAVAPGAKLALIDPLDYTHKVVQARHSLAETLAKLTVLDTKALTMAEVEPRNPAEAKSVTAAAMRAMAALDVEKLPMVAAAEAAAQEAEATVNESQAAVAGADAEIAGAEADIVGAAATLANAKVKLDEAVRRAGSSTQEELADKRTGHASAKAALDSANAKLSAANAKSAAAKAKLAAAKAKRDTAKAKAQVARSEAAATVAEAYRKKAALDAVQKDLDDTTIYAPQPKAIHPIAGAPEDKREYFVTRRKVAVGDYTKVAGEVFRLVLKNPLKLRALVPERFDSQVRKDQEVELTVEAYPQPFRGIISYKNVVDQSNRTFEIEAIVPNTDPERPLNPGTFAKAEVLTGQSADALMVPQEAIVSFAGITKVFVVEAAAGGPAAREVLVSVGLAREFEKAADPGDTGKRRERLMERWVEVRPVRPEESNLKKGDRVITSGNGKLSQGRRIELKEPAAPAGKKA